MDVVSDVTHQWNDNWLSGHWTMADDPPRVLNIFKCIHELREDYFGKYLILVTTRPWSKHYQNRCILEEYGELDPLTAQSVVYEMLEKYGGQK